MRLREPASQPTCLAPAVFLQLSVKSSLAWGSFIVKSRGWELGPLLRSQAESRVVP